MRFQEHENRGGKREGAGRPKSGLPRIRIQGYFRYLIGRHVQERAREEGMTDSGYLELLAAADMAKRRL